MDFRVKVGTRVAISNCGQYEIRMSTHRKHGSFYNAWHVPSGAHVGAGYKKADVKRACEDHAKREAVCT